MPLELPYLPLPSSSSVRTTGFGALSSPNRRQWRRPAVAVLLLFVVVLLFRPSSTPTTPTPDIEEQFLQHRRAAAKSRIKAAWKFDDPILPRAIHGDKIDFTTYLNHHFPPDSPDSPHIWITLADEVFARTGAANLYHFVQQLNSERRAKYEGKKKDTQVVTLCLDEKCVEESERRGMFAYGGFERTRPEMVRCPSLFSACCRS
jgi:hypothetical protein